MRRHVFILILFFASLSVIWLAISSRGEVVEKSISESNLSCSECHPNAKVYPVHIDGYSYCQQCHGSGVHSIHTFDCKTCHQNEPLTLFCHGADPDVFVPTADGVICKACHENNLVDVHENSCQTCHYNINEIHRKADIAGGVGDV